MQSANELIERVRGIVGDAASVPRIFQNLNDGIARVVRNTRPPDLQISDTVEVAIGSASAQMPELFFGPRVFSAKNLTTGLNLRSVFYRNVEFLRTYPEIGAGPVEAVLIRGNTVWVANRPTVKEILEFKFLSKPTYFKSVDDKGRDILYLPDRLGEKALVMYAAMEEYRIIEDGVDGDEKNFLRCEKALIETEGAIREYFGTENFEDGGPVIAHDASGLSGRYERIDYTRRGGFGL